MHDTAQDITRKAKSNLAFALSILPRDKRRDLTVFYAFCRRIDDLADDEGILEAQRRELLGEWKRGLLEGFDKPNALQRDLVGVREHHRIPNELLIAIIEGCEMDLDKLRYENWQELDDYIWKVSCAVGLVCIRLFGCTHPQSVAYAASLGRALQLTNILRDVGEDLRDRNRIYLPLEDLKRFGCTEEDLVQGNCNATFLELMKFEAERAFGHYADAQRNLSEEDHNALKPARIMADIYRKLLERMREDGFQVFGQRYRIGKLEKLFIALCHLMD